MNLAQTLALLAFFNQAQRLIARKDHDAKVTTVIKERKYTYDVTFSGTFNPGDGSENPSVKRMNVFGEIVNVLSIALTHGSYQKVWTLELTEDDPETVDVDESTHVAFTLTVERRLTR